MSDTTTSDGFGLDKDARLAAQRAAAAAQAKALTLDPAFPYIAMPFPVALLKSMTLYPSSES